MADNQQEARDLFEKAKADIAADMRERGIGAILWDLKQASFHFPPQVTASLPDGNVATADVQGMYLYKGEIYLITEKAKISTADFYNPDYEVPPVVVTLTESQAEKELGQPTEAEGFTTGGTIPEWLTLADCYFEALALDNDD